MALFRKKTKYLNWKRHENNNQLKRRIRKEQNVSGSRLGHFLNVASDKFSYKNSQIYCDFLGYFEKQTLFM